MVELNNCGTSMFEPGGVSQKVLWKKVVSLSVLLP